MNQPTSLPHDLTAQTANPANIDSATIDPAMAGQAVLNLRDIHLPEVVSWWPLATGWWLLLAGLLLITIGLFVARSLARKNHLKKQLKRDIKTELDQIKKQFQQSKNKAQLAKALSKLLRRASISYYPKTDLAGLTGTAWLKHLDDTHNAANTNKQFQSDTGETLLTAPYLPADSKLNFDAQTLIQLCESWLFTKHDNKSTADIALNSPISNDKSSSSQPKKEKHLSAPVIGEMR